MKNTKIFRLIITSLCIAIGVVLPVAFHSIPNAGSIFLPMHIPVLLCGLICGPFYGLACGILAPLLSCLLTGMPPVAFFTQYAMRARCLWHRGWHFFQSRKNKEQAGKYLYFAHRRNALRATGRRNAQCPYLQRGKVYHANLADKLFCHRASRNNRATGIHSGYHFCTAKSKAD